MGLDYIKFYWAKWLWGSGRMMTPEKRGVWADFLALAAGTKLRDGALRFDIGQPMSRDYIAGVLRLNRETLDACIEAFKVDINADDGLPRLQELDDGTLFLTNFVEFQGGDAKTIRDRSDERKRLKKISGEKSRQNKQSIAGIFQAVTRAVNELNVKMGAIKYEVIEGGKILDKTTGSIIDPRPLFENSDFEGKAFIQLRDLLKKAKTEGEKREGK